MKKAIKKIKERIEVFEEMDMLMDFISISKKSYKEPKELISVFCEEMFILLLQETVLISEEAYELAARNKKEIDNIRTLFENYLTSVSTCRENAVELVKQAEKEQREYVTTLTIEQMVESLDDMDKIEVK